MASLTRDDESHGRDPSILRCARGLHVYVFVCMYVGGASPRQTDEAHAALVMAFYRRAAHKTYLALAEVRSYCFLCTVHCFFL